MPKKKVVGIDD